jgi:hypothetical protein
MNSVHRVKKSKILLFGDSHVYAVERAIYHRNFKRWPIPLTAYRRLKEKGGKQLGDLRFEGFLDLIKTLEPHDIVLSMIGGNQHSIFSMVQHPQPFDFFDAESPAVVEPGAQIIPYRIIEELFAEGIRRGDVECIATIRRSTAARVVHIIPPPPKADNAYIQQYHEAVFATDIASRGVSPASLRLKFWKLQTRILERSCREAEVEILLPPAATLDEGGFLAPKFYAKDATHANPAYGEAVLTEIEERFVAVNRRQAVTRQ